MCHNHLDLHSEQSINVQKLLCLAVSRALNTSKYKCRFFIVSFVHQPIVVEKKASIVYKNQETRAHFLVFFSISTTYTLLSLNLYLHPCTGHTLVYLSTTDSIMEILMGCIDYVHMLKVAKEGMKMVIQEPTKKAIWYI